MPQSRRYSQLKRRVDNIEALFLPKIKLSGNYSKKEQDFTRAYLLLTHAEIEAYLEETAEKKAKTAFKKWQLNRTKSNILLSLASFDDKSFSETDLETRVHDALSRYIHSLKNNHGVKEKNILNMLLPLGVEISDIDTTWLNTVSSFATSRGEIAHTSAKVQSPLDPATLKNTLNQILSGIANLDEAIKKLK